VKTEQKVVAELGDLQFGYFDPELGDWVALDDEEGRQKLLQREDAMDCIIRAVQDLVNDVRELGGQDLSDIWKRIDRLEARLEQLEE
jgi:hypothetical protein